LFFVDRGAEVDGVSDECADEACFADAGGEGEAERAEVALEIRYVGKLLRDDVAALGGGLSIKPGQLLRS
jgi:hypothetical protein